MSGRPLPAAQEVSVSQSADQHPTSDAQPSSLFPTLPRGSRAGDRGALPDTDLSDEIRLMRTILDHLAEDIPANHRDIVHTVGVLARVTSLHARRGDGH